MPQVAAADPAKMPDTFPIKRVLLGAMLLRLSIFLVAWLLSPDLSGFNHRDTQSYLDPAMALAYQGRFGLPGAPEILRTPGYPLFLVPGILVGQPILVPIFVQIILSCSTVYLIFRIGKLLFGRADVAGLGALLYAIDPFSTLYVNKLATETLFVFCLVIFLHEYLSYLCRGSWVRLISSAAALSAAVYVKPVGCYLPLAISAAFAAWTLARQRGRMTRLLPAVVFFLLSMGLVGLWQMRNVVQAGYFQISAAQDYNLYFYNGAAVLAAEQGKSMQEVQAELGLYDEEIYFRHHPEQRNWSEAARYQDMGREGMKILLRHPYRYARIHLRGMLAILVNPNDIEYLRLFGISEGPRHWVGNVMVREGFLAAVRMFLRERPPGFGAALFLGVFLWSYLILSVVGLLSLRTFSEIKVITVLVMGLYFVVLPGGPLTDGRYRQPLVPIVCILGGYGLSVCNDRLRRRKRVLA